MYLTCKRKSGLIISIVSVRKSYMRLQVLLVGLAVDPSSETEHRYDVLEMKVRHAR